MPSRAMVFEGNRIGVETTPGTPVIATRDLGSFGFAATPAAATKNFTPSGAKYATTGTLISEQTNFKIDGMATYNELQYALAGVLTTPVITTPGGGTLSRLWTFNVNSNAPDTPVTYTLEKGTDTVRAAHYPWVTMTDLTLGFSRKDMVKMGGSAFGQPLIDDRVRWLVIAGVAGTYTVTVGANTTTAIAFGATAVTLDTALETLASVGAGKVTTTGGPGVTAPIRLVFDKSVDLTTVSAVGTGGTTATITRMSPGATQLPLLPISPTEINIYTASSYALLSSAQAINVFDFNWGITGRQNPFSPMNTSYGTGFAGTNEVAPKTSLSFSVEGNALAGTFINNVRAQDLIFLRVQATGPLIEGALYNQLTIDTAVRIGNIGEDKDVSGGGLLGKTFPCEWMKDPTTGRPSVVTLQNTQTAL